MCNANLKCGTALMFIFLYTAAVHLMRHANHPWFRLPVSMWHLDLSYPQTDDVLNATGFSLRKAVKNILRCNVMHKWQHDISQSSRYCWPKRLRLVIVTLQMPKRVHSHSLLQSLSVELQRTILFIKLQMFVKTSHILQNTKTSSETN